MAPTLEALGVSRSDAGESKERQEMAGELVNAIWSDMTILANEERDRQKQMAGYWRYATKHTYNTMVRKNQPVDWRTGEKLAEVETEASVEVGVEAQEAKRLASKPASETGKDERVLCCVARTASLKREFGEVRGRSEGRRRSGGRVKRREILLF